MKTFAVFGDPIHHSLSPYIHHYFSQQTGIELSYKAVHVPKAAFEQQVTSFFADGGYGLNITIPHKRAAWQIADIKQQSASITQTANTLTRQEDHILAENTDGTGLCQDIQQNLGWPLGNIALVGAGGAARSVIPSLIDAGATKIILANRTPANAHQLITDFPKLPLVYCAMDQLADQDYSLLINATAAGLTGPIEFPPDIIHSNLYCYDMVYSKESTTPFIKWAHQYHPLASADGLGMLVEQAALSFKIWHNITPNTSTLLKELRGY